MLYLILINIFQSHTSLFRKSAFLHLKTLKMSKTASLTTVLYKEPFLGCFLCIFLCLLQCFHFYLSYDPNFFSQRLPWIWKMFQIVKNISSMIFRSASELWSKRFGQKRSESEHFWHPQNPIKISVIKSC